MFSNSRGIHYTSPPTADDEPTPEEERTADETTDGPTADTTPAEADANWTGDVPADD